jgi:hypothetical protein
VADNPQQKCDVKNSRGSKSGKETTLVKMMTVMKNGRKGLTDETHVMRTMMREPVARRSANAKGRRKGGQDDTATKRMKSRAESSTTATTHATACRNGLTATGSVRENPLP